MADAPRQLFKVHGLDCAHEVALLRAELEGLEGVDELGFDLLKGRLTVAGSVARSTIEQGVARAGLKAEPWGEESGNHRELL